MPIEIGVTRNIGLGEKEAAEFFFLNDQINKLYNIDLEITSIMDKKHQD